MGSARTAATVKPSGLSTSARGVGATSAASVARTVGVQTSSVDTRAITSGKLSKELARA